ncbi:Tetratricopeptide repeat protein 24 [Larimichthys crocea]|uniref:Tetratricopeptide repeat protein 24 n=1 Tax=Larimichthys crocea TaxID=215358 RepID=A0A6G0ID26_LARCR|nr:Tetratricopeptide repeat protein 24 [Larimichthys crocea]
MASDATPPGDNEVKVRRKRRQKEVKRKEIQVVDIEELTSDGHGALQEGRTEDALSCFNNALKAAGQLQDSRVLRACSFNLGPAYVEAGQPGKGLDLLQQAQPGPKADRLPDLQFNLALAHNALGQSREAADYFLHAAQLYRSQGDGRSEGDACMEMSRCYSRIQVRTGTRGCNLDHRQNQGQRQNHGPDWDGCKQVYTGVNRHTQVYTL